MVQPLAQHDGNNRPCFDEVRVLENYMATCVEDGSGFLFLSQKGARRSRYRNRPSAARISSSRSCLR
jgi:hypothetical protein